MKTKSINRNGCSVCESGQENHTLSSPAHRPDRICCQYDYRHADGRFFSCVDTSPERCRARRDEWLRERRSFTRKEQSIL